LQRREFWGDKVTVGQALDQCYRFKVLEEPDKQDIKGFRDNVSDLVLALRLMNVWTSLPIRPVAVVTSVYWVRNIKVSALCDYFHDYSVNAHQPPRCQDSSFRSHELGLELLRDVGKLRIEWTEFLDNHLRLDVGSATLKIFWFGFSIQASPLFQ